MTVPTQTPDQFALEVEQEVENEKRLNNSGGEYKDPVEFPTEYVDIEYIGSPEVLLEEVKRRLEDYRSGRITYEPIYYEAVAFATGRQYCEYNVGKKNLEYVKAPSRFSQSHRVTVNMIDPYMSALVSHATKNLPTANVMPQSASTEDVYAAKASEHWLEHSTYNRGMQDVYREAALCSITFGHGWIFTGWDETGGRAFADYEQTAAQKVCPDCHGSGKIPTSPAEPIETRAEEMAQPQAQQISEETAGLETPCETCGGNGFVNDEDPVTGMERMTDKIDPTTGKKIKTAEWFEGEVVKEAVGPLDLYYDIGVTKWRYMPDCIRVEFMAIDEIKRRYSNCEDIRWDDGTNNAENPWQMAINFQIDQQAGTGQHGLPVYTYWGKATRDYPLGLQVVWIKDKIRIARPMPTLNGDDLPFDHFKFKPIAGLLRGMGLPELMKPTQSAYNKVLSQILENQQRMNNLNWVYPDTVTILNTITNESGQHIKYSGTGPAPDIKASPALPSTGDRLLLMFEKSFQVIAGVPNVMMGLTDPSFNSGDQITAATENSRSTHVFWIDQFVEAIARSCSKELRFVQHNLDTETLIHFLGPDGHYEQQKFTGAMIKDNWDVKMLPASALSQTRSAQMKELEMYCQIVMNGQVDGERKNLMTDKIIDFISQGDKKRLITEINRHEMKVKRIIDDIKNGVIEPQQVQAIYMPWHAPFSKTWLTEIENVLDSEDFDYNWEQPAKFALVELWKVVTLAAKQLAAQAATALATGAGLPAPPAPGSPAPAGPSKPGMGQPLKPGKPEEPGKLDTLKSPVEGAPPGT